jgi:hypothetical protein
VRRIIILVCLLLVLVTGTSFAEQPKTIELYDLIKELSINETSDKNVIPWDVLSESPEQSPIAWETDGVQFYNNVGYRVGKTVVTINNEPLKILKKYTTNQEWGISLLGRYYDRGISCVNINLVKSVITFPTMKIFTPDSYFSTIFHADEIKIIDDKSKGFSEGRKMYQVNVPGKKPTWLVFTYSFGASGMIGEMDLDLYFSKDLAYKNKKFNN